MLEEKESLLHEMQSQEKEFKLQNQTAMEELSLVCSTNCSRAIVQGTCSLEMSTLMNVSSCCLLEWLN